MAGLAQSLIGKAFNQGGMAQLIFSALALSGWAF